MMVAEQPAMPVVVPAGFLMPVGGVVVAGMGIMHMVMAAVMPRFRPGGGLLVGGRMVMAGAGRTVRLCGGGVVMGVVMAIRAMVVLAVAHGA
ncbi:hypothetical protein ACM0P6_11800 [Komagataeibacter sucrofermentans]|uniref:hypothetical protein n=1 Tax=Komagataeibacter sucrofermentans TaxID=1053551 RepID=UPI001FC8F298|nr:hypothetical protein [Komagataeibacter sucrofermentans]